MDELEFMKHLRDPAAAARSMVHDSDDARIMARCNGESRERRLPPMKFSNPAIPIMRVRTIR